jgi:hypothetical protein
MNYRRLLTKHLLLAFSSAVFTHLVLMCLRQQHLRCGQRMQQ